MWEGLGFLVNSINIERSTEAVFEIGFEEGWGGVEGMDGTGLGSWPTESI